MDKSLAQINREVFVNHPLEGDKRFVLRYVEIPLDDTAVLEKRRNFIKRAFVHRVNLIPTSVNQITSELSQIYGPESFEGDAWIKDLSVSIENTDNGKRGSR